MIDRTLLRNILLLAACQGMLLCNGVTLIAVNGLVGRQLRDELRRPDADRAGDLLFVGDQGPDALADLDGGAEHPLRTGDIDEGLVDGPALRQVVVGLEALDGVARLGGHDAVDGDGAESLL